MVRNPFKSFFRSRVWRWARRVWLAVSLLIVLLVCLSAVTLLLPSGRQKLLDTGLHYALEKIPGTLTGHWSWPSLNRLEGSHLVWVETDATGKEDTLAVMEKMYLEIDLKALGSRELRIAGFQAQGSLIDTPAIMRQFPTTPPDPTVTAAVDTTAQIPWFHPGPFAGIPAFELNNLELELTDLILPEGIQVADLSFEGAVSALSPDFAGVEVTTFGGVASSAVVPRWTAELTSLHLNAEYEPRLKNARLDSLSARLTRLTAEVDTMTILAGPLDFYLDGQWKEGLMDFTSHLGFEVEIPVSLGRVKPGLEFRQFSGQLETQWSGNTDRAQVQTHLKLDPTTDVERGRIQAVVDFGLLPEPHLASLQVDTFSLAWRGTEIAAGGIWDGMEMDGWARAHLPDLQLPRLLVPQQMPGISGRMKLESTFNGPWSNPHLTASFQAQGQVQKIWDLPALQTAKNQLPAEFPRDEFQQFHLEMDGNLAGTLDQLAVKWRSDAGRSPGIDRGLFQGQTQLDILAGTMSTLVIDTLAVAIDETRIQASGWMDTLNTDLGFGADIESMALLEWLAPESLRGTDLNLKTTGRVHGPFQNLHLNAETTGRLDSPHFSAADLRLQIAGTAESIEARVQATNQVRMGNFNADSLGLFWHGRLAPDSGPPSGEFRVSLIAPLTNGHLSGTVTADTTMTFVLDSLEFGAAQNSITNTRPFTIEVGPGPRDLELSQMDLRGDLGNLSLKGGMHDDEISLLADVELFLAQEWLDTLFPAPFWSAKGGLDLALKSQLEMDSALGSPANISGFGQLDLIPRNQDPTARLYSHLRTTEADSSGLMADLNLALGETPLLQGAVFLPGALDPATGAWKPSEDQSGNLLIPETPLPLEFINRFLPEEVSLAGELSAGVDLKFAQSDTATLDQKQGDVAGHLLAKHLQIHLPNRSRVELDSDLTLGGRLIDPRLEGKTTITSALFRLPEIQRTLLPLQGESILWEAARADTQLVLESWNTDQDTLPTGSTYLPDLNLQVSMPGNFRVIGYGLESELSGNVTLTRGWDEKNRPVPLLRGRVRVVEGTLRAMNRVFEFERGQMDLEGKIPPDPALDLLLTTNIDGTVIRIRVTGTAMKPDIVLESEPAMVQADIMAFILFGQPFNELDSDQGGSLQQEQSPAQQLRKNLEALALVFGTTGFQNKVSGMIGVDQVQLGSDSAGGSTLVLGKFLNPRLLLKYQQSLERSGTYDMTLQYTINRVFKLITTYGQGDEASGVEFRWQRRY